MSSCFPQLAIGAVVRRGSAVLLVQRGQPPNAGQWTVPGGKVQPGESLQQAAEREIREETGVMVQAGEPVFCFDIIERNADASLRYHYVIVDLLADYVSGEPQAADDARDAAWIEPEALSRLDVNPMTRQLLDRLSGQNEAEPASDDSDDQQGHHSS